MGTSNFHNVNASNVYAVLMNYEDVVYDEDGNETDETEMRAPDTWECDMFIKDIKEDAKEKAPAIGFSYHHTCNEDPHELRSYSSIPLFQFYRFKKFGDIDITVNINCVLRVGYYEGANLDWFITYDVMGNNTDELDFLYYTEYQSDMPAGMIKIQNKLAETWASNTADELVNVTEEFFKEHSMPLGVSARFSSGETWYTKVS